MYAYLLSPSSYPPQQYTKPLHAAVSGGYWEIVRLLLEHGAEVDCVNASERSPLHFAVGQNHVNIVRYLLSRGADCDHRDSKRRTPLHMACRAGYGGVVNILLNEGTDINAEDEEGFTPLHYASYRAHVELVRLLIRRGADTNRRSVDGRTPLECTHEAEVIQCFDMRIETMLQRTKALSKAAQERADLEASLRMDAQKHLEEMTLRASLEQEGRMNMEAQVQIELARAEREHHANRNLRDRIHQAQGDPERAQETPWLVSESALHVSDMVIGHGRHGAQLKVATWLQMEVCAKQLAVDLTKGGLAELEELSGQLHLLHSLRHPHIVSFLGASLSTENPPVLLYELLPQNLAEVIQLHKRKSRGLSGLAIERVIGIGLDVARGLHYLHHCGVTHGALTTRKVMMTAGERAKLIYSPGQNIGATKQIGPMEDVYCLGLLLCEMATGRAPNPNNLEEAYVEVPEARLREIVRRCLETSADERPNTDELIGMLKLLRS